jgi:hypothetical protein
MCGLIFCQIMNIFDRAKNPSLKSSGLKVFALSDKLEGVLGKFESGSMPLNKHVLSANIGESSTPSDFILIVLQADATYHNGLDPEWSLGTLQWQSYLSRVSQSGTCLPKA